MPRTKDGGWKLDDDADVDYQAGDKAPPLTDADREFLATKRAQAKRQGEAKSGRSSRR